MERKEACDSEAAAMLIVQAPAGDAVPAGGRAIPSSSAMMATPVSGHADLAASRGRWTGRSRFALWVTGCVVVLLGALWATVIVKLHIEREAEIATAKKNTANLARAFEEHTVRTLREADQLLLFIMVQNSAQVVRDDSGRPLRIDGVVVDVTERKRAEDRADRLARYDALTDLPNRGLFQDRLDIAIAHARRRGEVLGVMLVNLDRFKKINEDLGLEAGDRLLRDVASRLQASLRDVDSIARFGGDEFAVLVEGLATNADIEAVAEKLMRSLAAPFGTSRQEIFVSASIGIAAYPDGQGDPRAVLQYAEIAMRRVKQDGGYQFYEAGSMPPSRSRLEIESRLRRALERGELAVHYQPKVNILTGAISGAEACCAGPIPIWDR
ncbi:MAG: diguanylate cyclase domain-containing protein [Betaproteobacteria bacterium]